MSLEWRPSQPAFSVLPLFVNVDFQVLDLLNGGHVVHLTDFNVHDKCYRINLVFFLVLASLEENHLQDEGVCSLAEGLKRNSSLKVLK